MLDATDIYKIKILRKLKKFFAVEDRFNLLNVFDSIREKHREFNKFLINYILNDENYKGNKIFKLDIIPPELATEDKDRPISSETNQSKLENKDKDNTPVVNEEPKAA